MTTTNQGYSGTPLGRKLGLRAGARNAVIGAPESFLEAIGAAELRVRTMTPADFDAGAGYDYLHLFVRERVVLEAVLPALHTAIADDGMIWISWPKRAAKAPTDLTENVVRELALAHRLVDVKVAAIDATWSGLKLVIPLVRRHRP